MGQIFETVVRFFKEDELHEWNFQEDREESRLILGFQGENGSWNCLAQALEDDNQFVFYSIIPLNVPTEKRQVTAEYLIRANYGLIIGSFEMDFSDGEVRYKTSIDVEGDDLSPALIKQIVYTNLFRTDQYLLGLLAVVYSNVLPAEAIAQIEG